MELAAEAHNDFIFAIIGEELGLPGTLVILVLFALLAWACYRLVTAARDRFVRVATAGVMAWLIRQAIINIGAVIGLLPVIGVPLPLVSAGGSALVTTLLALGMLLSFARSEPGAAPMLAARPGVVTPLVSCPPGGPAFDPSQEAVMGPLPRPRPCCSPGEAAPATSPRCWPSPTPCARRDPGIAVTALGTETGLEARLVPGSRLRPALRATGSAAPSPDPTCFGCPAGSAEAVVAARRAIDETRAEVVVGFGGYVSTPAYLAARQRRIPIVVHEQNARPGWPTGSARGWTPLVATTFSRHRLPHARGSGCRCAVRSPSSTAPRPAREALTRFGLDPQCPPCSSPADPSGRNGSTTSFAAARRPS